MIVIKIPKKHKSEISWISHVIFKEFLEIKYRLEINQNDEDFYIELNNKKIIISNIFLLKSEQAWLRSNSIHSQTQYKINITDYFNGTSYRNEIPVLFGEPKIDITENKISFHFDILGTIFFILSGYKDSISKVTDRYGRLPYEASIIHKLGIIDRPLVDEYVEVLWKSLLKLDPSIRKKNSVSTVSITCDVDNPYSSYVNSIRAMVRKTGGDLIKRKSLHQSLMTITNFLFSSVNVYSFDPLNKFKWMMNLNEKYGNKMIFYFIFLKTNPRMDGFYSIDEKRIRKLIKLISDRGHEICLHASYDSSLDPKQLNIEVKKLKQVLSEEMINQAIIGNRQHYLKFSSLKTFRYLDAAGVAHDSSLGFASHPGFRCGTTRNFTMYDLENRKQLEIIQRPLIVMDDSIISEEYMGLKEKDSILSYVLSLKDTVDYFGGNFTLLWHNTSLTSYRYRRIYEQVIRSL